MKALVLVPLLLAVTAAAGLAVVKLAGWPVHWREMAFGLTINLIAGEAAFGPLLLVRGLMRPGASGNPNDRRDPGAVAQAALLGTVVQMLIGLALMAAVSSAGLVQRQDAFVWWLLAFYWSGLIAVVIVMAGAVRRAARNIGPGPSAEVRQDRSDRSEI